MEPELLLSLPISRHRAARWLEIEKSMRFSERHGLKPMKTVVQLDSIDPELRNALWNALSIHYWETIRSDRHGRRYLSLIGNEDLRALCREVWLEFFKKPIDTLGDNWEEVYLGLRKFFFECRWYEVYDFIEHVAEAYQQEALNNRFRKTCNESLEREVSAYRFVDKKIAPIVSSDEILSIEEAVQVNIPPVQQHLARALVMLGDRRNPDYRNSIKESISAVESLVKKVTGSDKGTLGDLLRVLEQRTNLHPAVKAAFSNLYGYTSDADGIRHALIDKDRVTFDQAKFMLVACSAFINYVSGALAK